MCNLLIYFVISKKPSNFESLPSSQWINVKSITNLKLLFWDQKYTKLQKKKESGIDSSEAQLLPYAFTCVSCAIFTGIRIKKTHYLHQDLLL